MPRLPTVQSRGMAISIRPTPGANTPRPRDDAPALSGIGKARVEATVTVDTQTAIDFTLPAQGKLAAAWDMTEGARHRGVTVSAVPSVCLCRNRHYSGDAAGSAPEKWVNSAWMSAFMAGSARSLAMLVIATTAKSRRGSTQMTA